jgi:hypothetical protein
MSRTVVRCLAILLAALFTLSLFACGEKTPSPGESGTAAPGTDTPVPTTDEPVPDDGLVHDSLAPADFDGAAYAVVGDQQTAIAVTADEIRGEPVNDAKYNASRRVEERFNVVISHEVITGSTEDFVRDMIAAGEDRYSIVIAQPASMASTQMAGYYLNLRDVDQFDYSKPWWTRETDEVAIGRDKAYIASSFFTYFPLLYARVMVINKEVAANFNLEIPYDKVYDGTWYMDDMLQMCAAATADKDGDGKMTEEDYWGISYQLVRFTTFQASQGVTVISKDENNMPYIDFDIDRAQRYLDKVYDLLDYYGFDGKRNQGVAHFMNGNSLFCYCYLRSVCEDIRDSGVTYGFLLTPKLDETQENYIMAGGDQYWAIPTTAVKRVDMIGTVTEAMSCECYNYVIPAFFESTMQYKLSEAPEDTRVLQMIPDTLTVRFEQIYQQELPSVESLYNLAADTGSGNVTSTFKAAEGPLTAELESLIRAFKYLS